MTAYEYQGETLDGKKHGTGKLFRSDGTVLYEGEFYDGKMHGMGKYTFPNGDVYEGEWHDSKMHGTGTYTVHRNGRVWEGEWRDGKKHEGEFKDGALPEAAAGSDAEADDCPPAGEGGPKRKRKASGAARAAKKAAKNAQDEDGGFTDKGRMEFKEEGGHLITGNKRSCLPDALGMLLMSLSISVKPEELRSIMPTDPDENTRFVAADEYVTQFGLTLQRVTQRFMQKGGVAYHLLNATGRFVVQLRITEGKEDKTPDLHCVAYDGETVRDNFKYAKVKNLDASDRMPGNAHKVFDSLFKNLEVRIKNVYELLPKKE